MITETPSRTTMNRTRYEIQRDILHLLSQRGGCLATHIMGTCNLAYDQMNGYLERMMAGGLISRDNVERVYTITKRGSSELKKLDSFIEKGEAV